MWRRHPFDVCKSSDGAGLGRGRARRGRSEAHGVRTRTGAGRGLHGTPTTSSDNIICRVDNKWS